MGELTTRVVKHAYSSRGEGVWRMVELDYEFDKWLASVKAEAWAQGYHMSQWDVRYEPRGHHTANPYREEN